MMNQKLEFEDVRKKHKAKLLEYQKWGLMKFGVVFQQATFVSFLAKPTFDKPLQIWKNFTINYIKLDILG